jgi:hypothetical protein
VSVDAVLEGDSPLYFLVSKLPDNAPLCVELAAPNAEPVWCRVCDPVRSEATFARIDDTTSRFGNDDLIAGRIVQVTEASLLLTSDDGVGEMLRAIPGFPIPKVERRTSTRGPGRGPGPMVKVPAVPGADSPGLR